MGEWWRIANGPATWLGGFILAGLASLGAYLMYRKAYKVGLEIGLPEEKLREAIRASAITVIGPSSAIVVGMLAIIVSLSPGVAWLRESAGIGSIMYELATASFGAQAAGESLGPGMSERGFVTALFVMSTACLPWLIGLIVFTPIVKPVRDKAMALDPKLFPLIAVVMMLVAFANCTAKRLLPRNAGSLAVVISFICTVIILKWADRMGKPQIKEYALTVSMVIAMFLAQLLVGGR